MFETLEESFGLFVSERCNYAGINCTDYIEASSEFDALYKLAKRAVGDNEDLLIILSGLENAVSTIHYTLADACYQQGFTDALRLAKLYTDQAAQYGSLTLVNDRGEVKNGGYFTGFNRGRL